MTSVERNQRQRKQTESMYLLYQWGFRPEAVPTVIAPEVPPSREFGVN